MSFVDDLKAGISEAFGVKARGSNREVPPALTKRQPFTDFAKWDLDRALKDGFEINEWVFACVNAYTRHAASVPWRVSAFTDQEQKALFQWEYESVPPSQRADFMRDAHKKRIRGRWGAERKAHMQPKPNDPLEQILTNPNPFTTRQEFMERNIQHMLLGGNGIQVKVRGKVEGVRGYKTPFQLWPLFPQAVEIETDGQVPTKYLYAPEGKNVNPDTEKEYDPQDIVHFRFVAPREAVWGMAPLTAASRAVDTDVQFAKWNYNAARNRFVPDVVVSYKDELTPEAYSRARRRFNEQSTTADARRVFISGNPVEVHQMSLTPVEMDFIKSRGLNRQSICTIFGIFPSVIAVMEGVSVGNMDVILRHHWLQTMIPFMDRLQGTINLALAPEFGNNRFAWYDTNNVEALSDSLMERRRVAKIMHTMGVPLTVLNDNLDMGLDLDGVPLADEPIFPAGVVTGTQLLEGDGGDGSANPNTAPDGGEVVEPGDPQDPNEPPTEDVVADDPGDGVPDTMLSMSNGNADPHEGKRQWTAEEAREWLDDWNVEVHGWDTRDDWFEFFTNEDDVPTAHLFTLDKEEGLDCEPGIIRFYHGEQTQLRRERLLARVKSWGFNIP